MPAPLHDPIRDEPRVESDAFVMTRRPHRGGELRRLWPVRADIRVHRDPHPRSGIRVKPSVRVDPSAALPFCIIARPATGSIWVLDRSKEAKPPSFGWDGDCSCRVAALSSGFVSSSRDMRSGEATTPPRRVNARAVLAKDRRTRRSERRRRYGPSRRARNRSSPPCRRGCHRPFRSRTLDRQRRRSHRSRG